MSYRQELVQVAAVAVAAIQDYDDKNTKDDQKLRSVLTDIYDERLQQELKWGTQHHGKYLWLTILMEEVGEVANSILENHKYE